MSAPAAPAMPAAPAAPETPFSQPYATRAEASDAFASHVNRGKVNLFRALFAGQGGELIMGQREGARFADAYSGRWLWNCHCNGGTFNLGHRPPAVVAALRDALEHLDIGNHHLVSGLRAHLAARLAATTDGRLPGVVFGVGGGEANDLAIKVARARTGKQRIISASGGYHGHTGLALAAGDPAYRRPFGANPPGFTQVPWNDLGALARELGAGDSAAVLLETIPATLGMALPDPGYLAAAADLAHQRGALLILDEVQTGLGRTGTFWGYQHEGVTPDMVTTGKGLSGGMYPLTATLMTADLHGFFDEHPFIHISTFGGAELGCVAAEAMLDVTLAPGFLARVTALGERFRRGLAGLPVKLRQRGLFMGLDLGTPGAAPPATRKLLEHGIFALWANHDTAVVQLLPALTITDAEADAIIAALCEALS